MRSPEAVVRARAQVMQQNPRETLNTRACDGVPASSGAADAWRWSLGARLRETRLKIVPESRTLPERIPTDQHEERVRNPLQLMNGFVSWI